jgi:hypothetical protein
MAKSVVSSVSSFLLCWALALRLTSFKVMVGSYGSSVVLSSLVRSNHIALLMTNSFLSFHPRIQQFLHNCPMRNDMRRRASAFYLGHRFR